MKDQQGIYWARSGNRRLYIFKRLQRLGIVTTIPVDFLYVGNYAEIYRAEMTTENEGCDIEVRHQFIVDEIEAIESEWRQTTQRQAANDHVVPSRRTQGDVIDGLSSLSLTETRQGDSFSNVQSTSERYRLYTAVEQEELVENEEAETYE